MNIAMRVDMHQTRDCDPLLEVFDLLQLQETKLKVDLINLKRRNRNRRKCGIKIDELSSKTQTQRGQIRRGHKKKHKNFQRNDGLNYLHFL
jgi:hypothetical protein